MSGDGMTISERLASKKLVLATVAICIVGLRNVAGLELSAEDVRGIVAIATSGIWGQAAIDALGRLAPVMTSWIGAWSEIKTLPKDGAQ